MAKGIIRTILDNHRDIELYERAMTDIVLMLSGKDSCFRLQKYKGIPQMSYIAKKIRELKLLEELKPTQH